jgi:hypothetical protein
MIWYLITFAAGWYLREAVAMHKIRVIVKTMQEVEETPIIDELKVNIEKHNDQFYLYRDSDDQFIAQGATKADVIDVLKKRYPAQTVVVDPDNVKEVDFK